MKRLKKVLETLINHQEAIIHELKSLPSGSLSFRTRGYYHQTKEKTTGITHHLERIKQLARKKLLLVWKKQIDINLKHIKSGNFDKLDTRNPFDLIKTLPKTYQRLSLDYFFHPEVIKWRATNFKQNPYKPEQRIYSSSSGRMFRSKSEAIIATILERLSIPYHYEIALTLPGHTYPIYPDFIIKNPFTNKQIIWEHFGALSDPIYEKSMNTKMINFTTAGYIQHDTIIYTFEADIRIADQIKQLIQDIILDSNFQF